jgi:hypothetical protein
MRPLQVRNAFHSACDSLNPPVHASPMECSQDEQNVVRVIVDQENWLLNSFQPQSTVKTQDVK